MEIPYISAPDGVDFRDYSGQQVFAGQRDITLNGVLYRQTENGVFRVQNGKLIAITASERNMFIAMDNGTYIPPTQNTTPAVKTNQNQGNSNYLMIGIALVGILLLSKGK